MTRPSRFEGRPGTVFNVATLFLRPYGSLPILRTRSYCVARASTRFVDCQCVVGAVEGILSGRRGE